MKNNFITKIIGATLAFAMMIGGAVGINATKQAKEVNADTGDTYTLVTSASSIVDGDYVIFVKQDGSQACGTTQNTNNRTPVDITVTENSYVKAADDNVQEFLVVAGATQGQFGFHTGSGYIYSASSSNNNLKTNSTASSTRPTTTALWTIAISNNVTTVKNVTNTSYYLAFNGTSYFSQYKSGMSKTNIYKKVIASNVSSVEVSGDMSTHSFTTVQSWSHDGLTATITTTDSSEYTGDCKWSYNPATPAAAVVANSKNEVTNGSVTVTATAGEESDSITINNINVSYATVEQLKAATPATGDSDYFVAKGIVSQIGEINTSSNNRYASYYISDDGTTTGQYYVYKGKGIDGADITNSNDIQVGDVVVVYGITTNFNGTTKEFKQGNYLFSLDRPASTEPSITITTANINTMVGYEDTVLNADVENVPDGGSVAWESGNTDIATIVKIGEIYKAHAVAAGSTTITAKILNSSSEVVASNSITITITANALEDGDAFIIKAVHEDTTYYMTGITDNSGTASSTRENAAVFTAIEGETSGQFKIKYTNKYLSFSGSKNEIHAIEDGTADTALWTAIDNGSEVAIKNVQANTRKLQFNYNQGSPKFACYTSTQTSIAIEKVVAPEVDEVIVVGNDTANANDALSITQEFDFEVTYTDQNNLGTGLVTVEVKNSSDAEEGSHVDEIDQANGTITVTFTANDTFKVKVISLENEEKYAIATIIISGVHVPVLTDYNLYTDDLVEGDYLIASGENFVKAAITDNRAQYETIEPQNEKVSIENANIIWHIAREGEYYTIYNELQDKYLASTGTKNQAQLLDDCDDDKALWSYTKGNNTFELVNKFNSSKSINANLRQNGTFGFACYSTGTGAALTLYKRDTMSYLDSFTTEVKLVATETDGNIDSVSIKFKTKIAKYAWDAIVSDYGISEFGMMGYRTRKASPLTVEEKFDAEQDKNNLTTLLAVNADTYGLTLDEEEGYYSFTVKVNISGPSSYDLKFIMAPYIVVNGTYHFLDNLDPSVNYLAQNGLVESQLSQEALETLSGGQGE